MYKNFLVETECLVNNKNVEKSYIDFFNIGQTIVVLKEK